MAKFLARRGAAERATQRAAERAAEIEAAAKTRRGKPARPWQGRSVEEAPVLAHSPATARPATPPVGDAGARAHDPSPSTSRRGVALRRDHGDSQARLVARPRPSRALAELAGDSQAEAPSR